MREASFTHEPAKYFLASSSTRHESFDSAPSGSPVAFHLDPARRHDLEETIDRQMRVTLPSIVAPQQRSDGALVRGLPSDPAYDRAIAEGRGRLSFDVQSYRVAPDGDPRLYVRAHWTVGRKTATELSLWMRWNGTRAVVEQTDAWLSKFASYAEAKSIGSVAANPEFAGLVLNIVPAADGWAYVIVGRRGYESVSVSVLKYSPDGPRDTGVAYSYGC